MKARDNGDSDDNDAKGNNNNNGDYNDGDNGKGTDNGKSNGNDKSKISNEKQGQQATESLDLTSMKATLPRRNFSAHPNIKRLPGLDFNIAQDAPFTSQQNSGLVAKIFLPCTAVNQSASLEGLLSVANRIQCLMEVGLSTYEAKPNLVSVKDVIFFALRQLRGLNANWRFEAAPRKLSTIIGQVIGARKRFLARGGDMIQIKPHFLSFLEAIDDFISGVEIKIDAKQADSASPVFLPLAGRKRTSDDLEAEIYNPQKMRRVWPDDNEDGPDSPSKTVDGEVAYWRSKCKSLEASQRLEIQKHSETVARSVRNYWVTRMHRFWDVVRPAVNQERKDRGKPEVEADQLVQFLRASKLGDIGDDVLGLKN
ncbi:hypothetical protein N0V92_010591 [Colletotrichum tropicale]|nr:hypothetical protein N0V92_010591 [Colletotrichum tropicale]